MKERLWNVLARRATIDRPSCKSKVISSTRRDFGESRISESASITLMIFARSHRGALYLPIELHPGEQLSSEQNRAVLFRDVIPIAMIRRGTGVHRRVKHERNDYFNYPNERPYWVGRPQARSRRRVVSRGTSSGHRNSIKDIYCARPSDAFLRLLSRFPMNTAMRVFARLAGTLISRTSLLDGNDRESAMDRRERALFLPRKGMSFLGARKSLILIRLSDKKKRRGGTSRSAVIETDWKVLGSLLRADELEWWESISLSPTNALWQSQLMLFCSLTGMRRRIQINN